jgi:hypothetical protein
MRNNHVGYNEIQSDINNYLNFFSAINGRKDPNTHLHKYERCSLIIVDFKKSEPFIYSTTKQLKEAGIINEDSNFDYDLISIEGFVKDLIAEHKRRFKK